MKFFNFFASPVHYLCFSTPSDSVNDIFMHVNMPMGNGFNDSFGMGHGGCNAYGKHGRVKSNSINFMLKITKEPFGSYNKSIHDDIVKKFSKVLVNRYL